LIKLVFAAPDRLLSVACDSHAGFAAIAAPLNATAAAHIKIVFIGSSVRSLRVP